MLLIIKLYTSSKYSRSIKSALNFDSILKTNIHFKGRVSSKESNMDKQQRLPTVAMRRVLMLDRAYFYLVYVPNETQNQGNRRLFYISIAINDYATKSFPI